MTGFAFLRHRLLPDRTTSSTYVSPGSAPAAMQEFSPDPFSDDALQSEDSRSRLRRQGRKSLNAVRVPSSIGSENRRAAQLCVRSMSVSTSGQLP